MNGLFAVLFFLSLLCTPIFLILLLIRRFRKIPAGKYKKATIASAAIVVVSFIGFGLTMDPAPQIESIELSIPDHQTEYDINTEIPVNISVLPEDADTSSLEYIVDNGSLTFSETGIITGSAEGTYEVHIKSGDVESNALTISVVDIAAREEEQKLAEEKRLAEERAAKEAEEKRLAEEQAAKEAEEKRLAEEQAAKEAEEKRLAEEQAAKEAEEKRLAEERAAREAEEKRLAEEKAAQSGSTSSGSSSEPPAAASSSSTLVWVDDTAKRYHRKNGCGMDNAYQVTLEEAIAMGKTPCGRCY